MTSCASCTIRSTNCLRVSSGSGSPSHYARRLASDSQAYRLFFAMFPHLECDRKTHRRLAGLYNDYRRLNAQGLSLDDNGSHDADTLAAMLVALSDGLALQLLLDPGSIDMDRVVSLWETLVEATLNRDGATDAGGDETPGVARPRVRPEVLRRVAAAGRVGPRRTRPS